MKSMHESFDDELRERLRQYTEEPDKNLWQGIAPHIVSVRPEPTWIIWSQRTSSIVIGVVTMITVIQYGGENANAFKSFEISDQQQEGLNNPINGEIDKNPVTLRISGKWTSENIEQVELISKESIASNGEEIHQESPMDNLVYKESIENFQNESTRDSILNKDTIKTITKEHVLDTLKKTEQGKELFKRKNQRHRKYTLYFTAMPTFGYQRIESNQEDDIIIESIDRVPAFSTKRLGVRAELGAEFPLTKRLKLFSGLLYYQRKQAIDYTEKQLDSTIVTSGPNGEVIIEPEFSYVAKSVEHELKNIGLQVGVIYKLSRDKQRPLSEKEALRSTTMQPKKKFLHALGMGLEFHKALNETNEFNKTDGFTDPSAYVFFNVYYRLQYPNEGKLRAVFQPTLNYSFYINENLNSPFYVKPYGLGLNFGCTYNF